MNEFTAMTATIPTSTVDVLAEKIAKINKKGGTFRYRVTGTTTIERHVDCEGISKLVKVHASVVEVVGQQLTVDGSNWKFVAHLDHFTTPAIVTTAHDDNNDQTVAQYRDHAQHCDHCRQNRARRYTYIAENIDNGDRVQVGSTCLQAYFGDVTAENLISMATFLRQIPKWFDDEEFRGTRRPYYDTMTVLKGAAQSVLNRGYHKTTGADIPTKIDAPFINGFSQEAIDLAENAAAWIKALDTQKDFELDMQAAAGSEYVDYNKHGGILCYVIEAYRKHIAKQSANKVAALARTEDCPNDTARHTVTGTVISVKLTTDYYGVQTKLLMETDGGYKLFGTCPCALHDCEAGDRIRFACKVKYKDAGFGYINRPSKAEVLEA